MTSHRYEDPPHLSICAIIAVRNEADYLQYLLPRLAAQEIDVALIDNASSDATPALLEAYHRVPIVSVTPLPYPGYFSLTRQLEAKQALQRQIQHDWIIHQDADELLEAAAGNQNLRQVIEGADAAGYTVVNFDEFCFLPEPGADYAGRDYRSQMTRYYFFEPYPNRLNRAWKRCCGLDNRSSGGHLLVGDAKRVFPENQQLRHYIVLSQEHAIAKYGARRFDREDLARGFHRNRLGLTTEMLRLPPVNHRNLQVHDRDTQQLSTTLPTPLHYWQWERGVG